MNSGVWISIQSFNLFCREVLKEDEAGSLQASVADVIHKAKRKQLLDRPLNVRLGMVSGQSLVYESDLNEGG